MVQKIGIDFGTTNSLISVVTLKGKVKSFTVRDRPHPSVVHYEGADIVCGTKAKNKLQQKTIGVQGNTVRGPKKFIGGSDFSVGGVMKNPKEVVTDLMNFLIEDARDQDDDGVADLKHAVVTIPVAMDGRGRQALREALLDAGIYIEMFIHEPLAALYGYFKSLPDSQNELSKNEGRMILVFDWGGGTLDLTLCQVRNGSIVQIMNRGNNKVGGDYLDEAILNYIEEKHAQKYGWDVDTNKPRNPGMRAKLLEECEKAKIDLSRRAKIDIWIDDYFNAEGDEAEIEHSLTRSELDAISKSIVEAGIGEIEFLLSQEQAHVDIQSVALCLATGGMVNMPIIRQHLRELFGVATLEVSDIGDRIISEGAAWVAHDDLCLTLAKPFELVEARNSLLTVIPEGTKLPSRGYTPDPFNQSMYCADPRDGKAVFTFKRPQMVGKTASSDRRTTYENMVVPVNKDFPPMKERIDVSYEIDENLIIKINAQSLDERVPQELQIFDLEFALQISSIPPIKKPLRLVNFKGEQLGLTVRANISNDANAWELVPGELLQEYNRKDENAYLKKQLTQLQQDESSFYQLCSRCHQRYKIGCCSN
tara:strand:+ start:4307 stop:6079 length:1773 start_codon:yes stop_codon:yes gene_type:complete